MTKVAQELAVIIRMVRKKYGKIKNNIGFCDILRAFSDEPKGIRKKETEYSMPNNDIIPPSTNPRAQRVVKSIRQVYCCTTQKNTPKIVPIINH